MAGPRDYGERFIAAAESRGLDYELACGVGAPIAVTFGGASWAMPDRVQVAFEYFAIFVGGGSAVLYIAGVIRRLVSRRTASSNGGTP